MPSRLVLLPVASPVTCAFSSTLNPVASKLYIQSTDEPVFDWGSNGVH